MADTTNAIASKSGSVLNELAPGCFVFTSATGHNSGVVVGTEAVLVVDGQPTAQDAEALRSCIAKVTDLPVKYVVLTHFHAAQSLHAGVFETAAIIASDLSKRLLQVNGVAELALMAAKDSPETSENSDEDESAIASPTPVRPTLSFASSICLDLGECEVKVMHLGRGHTLGDSVVWVNDQRLMFAGDLVCEGTSMYCGDGHLGDWPNALRRVGAFRPEILVPGMGESSFGLKGVAGRLMDCAKYIAILADVSAESASRGNSIKRTLEMATEALEPIYGQRAFFHDYLPRNVARAYDEAHGLELPQVWTIDRERDLIDALNAKTHLSSGKTTNQGDATSKGADGAASEVPESEPVEAASNEGAAAQTDGVDQEASEDLTEVATAADPEETSAEETTLDEDNTADKTQHEPA
ncbi:MAG: MBL fold metallo-hydrolase [Rhodobacteraceae bacterium]|nr:MBL fold metallo-hydrolase [Paracoccaceae bacterium]